MNIWSVVIPYPFSHSPIWVCGIFFFSISKLQHLAAGYFIIISRKYSWFMACGYCLRRFVWMTWNSICFGAWCEIADQSIPTSRFDVFVFDSFFFFANCRLRKPVRSLNGDFDFVIHLSFYCFVNQFEMREKKIDCSTQKWLLLCWSFGTEYEINKMFTLHSGYFISTVSFCLSTLEMIIE